MKFIRCMIIDNAMIIIVYSQNAPKLIRRLRLFLLRSQELETVPNNKLFGSSHWEMKHLAKKFFAKPASVRAPYKHQDTKNSSHQIQNYVNIVSMTTSEKAPSINI